MSDGDTYSDRARAGTPANALRREFVPDPELEHVTTAQRPPLVGTLAFRHSAG
ncbi:hypothetical protein AB0M43_15385 [Longispora sp. NPDC051575]|uniref:hypothetical protein n=1 Tax=Longispora sp. NPDC051575 TaxID=3154943 RepID=UPI00343F4B04